ncbi:hypothetical protein U1Q18_010406 [Sarracenia purpurea var. burkii]
MNKNQTKRVLLAVEKKTGKFGDKTRVLHSKFSPETDDYKKSFPSLSGSDPKTQKKPNTLDYLFLDAAEAKISLLTMIRDLPLDRRSRRIGSAVVKNFEEDVKGAPFDSVKRASLKARVSCLKGVSPIEIAEGLNLTFCPSSSSRDTVSSGEPIEEPGVERNNPVIVDEVSEEAGEEETEDEDNISEAKGELSGNKDDDVDSKSGEDDAEIGPGKGTGLEEVTSSSGEGEGEGESGSDGEEDLDIDEGVEVDGEGDEIKKIELCSSKAEEPTHVIDSANSQLVFNAWEWEEIDSGQQRHSFSCTPSV